MGRLKLANNKKQLSPSDRNDSRAHKVGLENANGPEWARKEKGSKLMDNM